MDDVSSEAVLNVTWNDLDEMLDALAYYIKQSPIKPKYIYGISRGGLVPAVMLSHRLGGVPITFNPSEDFVIFVDDISDGGKSLTYYSTLSRCYTTAALFVRKDTEFVPDFSVEEISKEQWVNFPWEIKFVKNDIIKRSDVDG